MDPGRQIPSINFEHFLHGSTSDQKQVASAIDQALSTIGFIYLENHGIEQQKVDACFQWSKRFFALSQSEKNIAPHSPARSHHRGYSEIENEKVRGRICSKEGFDCGNPNDPEQPNIWPPEELLPGLQDLMEDFWKDCTKLIHQLLDCLSLALNLSSGALSKHHAKSLFTTSLIHYPSIPARRLRSGEVARNPAHSDFGTLTLLFQDDVGGLEIADMSSTDAVTSAELEARGKFIHVDPKPGTIVMNVGYLLMRWSNGRWKNTVHRVTEPSRQREEQTLEKAGGYGDEMIPERYSIAFFSAPDPETDVEALPGCWSEEVPKKWKPINVGAYLRRKRADVYA